MKQLILLCVIILSACGKQQAPVSCAGPQTGSWGGSLPLLELDDACGFKYTNTGCSSVGTYDKALAIGSGTFNATVSTLNGNGHCLAVGSYTCSYTLTDSSFTYNCK